MPHKKPPKQAGRALPETPAMALPTLTEEQRRAVSVRGISAAVSAGAGCGKTSVLTERFLSELHPAAAAECHPLSRLAAITFTERAAREMRDRIRVACRKKLLACPESEVDYWLNLLRELEAARISTIHAFCAALLRTHAVEAGLDPHFSVLEAALANTLLCETTTDVLRRCLAEGDEAVINLVVRFGLERVQEIISSLLKHRREIDWSWWLALNATQLAARWKEFVKQKFIPQLLQRIRESPVAKKLLQLAAAQPSSHPKMQERFAQLREHLPRLNNCAQLDVIAQAAKVQHVDEKHWSSKDIYQQFLDAAKELRDDIRKITSLADFDPEAMQVTAERAMQALRLAAAVAAAYEKEKRDLAALDFDDLLMQAQRLLTDTSGAATRKRLASQYHLVLVDELQDTERLQVELIKALCDGKYLDGKLFVVGDCQQSIYRFRGAEPQVFRSLCAEVPPEGRTPLTLNFRSQPAILDFVNALFSEELGAEYQPLRAARPQLGPVPAVELLLTVAGEKEESACEGQTAQVKQVGAEECRRYEAEWLARRIRELLDCGEKLVGDKERKDLRPVQPGDIALLFRALTDVEHYEEALQRHGINYYLVGGRAFYAQQEIYDLLNLLRAIHSRCDEVSLAGVLRSPIFSLYDETLFWLSRHPQGLAAGLFGADWPAELTGRQRRRAAHAANTLRYLRAIKDRVPVAQLIQEALKLTAYDALLTAEFLGERKLANLHKLIEQARSFDRSGIFSLSEFITQLSGFVARMPEEPLAATQPETTEAVKLMTIHQAKGLEFPVVIVPDLGRALNPQPPAATFHPELGPVLKEADETLGYKLLKEIESPEERAELKRLFYVAATRAADYLLLSAGIKNQNALTGPWLELLKKRFDLETGRPRLAEEKNGKQALLKIIYKSPPEEKKIRSSHRRPDLLTLVKKARRLAKSGQVLVPKYLAPIPVDVADRREYSFSRISGELLKAQPERETPGSVVPSAEASAGKNLGIIVHAVLAQLDFARPERLRELCARLVEQSMPGEERLAEEAVNILERFLSTPRAKELALAEEMYRELEFLLAWPPEKMPRTDSEASSSADRRYFRGFIDCLYLDAMNRWHLVDYKTITVRRETLPEQAARFEPQMLVYALAAEKALGAPPNELVVCCLPSGLEWQFPWDPDAKARVMELVNRVLP